MGAEPGLRHPVAFRVAGWLLLLGAVAYTGVPWGAALGFPLDPAVAFQSEPRWSTSTTRRTPAPPRPRRATTDPPHPAGGALTTYHRRRRQARLGRLTPIEYETIMTTQVALAA